MAPVTNAVVAILLVLSPAVGVGAVGVPVNVGELRFDFRFNESRVAMLTGLALSAVLSRLPKPRSDGDKVTFPLTCVTLFTLIVNPSLPAGPCGPVAPSLPAGPCAPVAPSLPFMPSFPAGP